MRPQGERPGLVLWIGLAVSVCLVHTSWAGAIDPSRKVIIVVFGGGTRYSESIGDPNHRFIPHLWNDMVPKGTLFTHMRVEHKVVHPNSTGSMVTGLWEWDDLDWTRPVAHPTVFEIYRKAHHSLDTAAWAFVYASILAQVGHSRADGYGLAFGANVVVPPTIPREVAERMDAIMADAAARGDTHASLEAARRCADLARQAGRLDLAGLQSEPARELIQEVYVSWKKAADTTSHDAFLTEAAIRCMERFKPVVLLVAFGEIDCAHYGSWSRYVEAIRRTDELTWRIWKKSHELPSYRDKTLLLVVPDHGRQLDVAGGDGFIHHSDFYTGQGEDEGCRRVWMVTVGPGIEPGREIDRVFPITAVAGTALDFLNLPAPGDAEPSILNWTTRDR